VGDRQLFKDVDAAHFCYLLDGASYRGVANVTRSGRPCLHWAANTPSAHSFRPETYPEAGLVLNFCRNPAEDQDSPWCFVAVAGGAAAEACAVAQCPPVPVSVPVPVDLITESSAPERGGPRLRCPATYTLDAGAAKARRMYNGLRERGQYDPSRAPLHYFSFYGATTASEVASPPSRAARARSEPGARRLPRRGVPLRRRSRLG
jgi:hypothetical protein